MLRRNGIYVPKQVSVIGFDHMQWSSWPLIDLRQPLAEFARRAVDLLIRRRNDPQSQTENVVLPVSLMKRASTARPGDTGKQPG